MGGDTKRLRNRIKSVNSTLHLTKAMGLVASSKLKKTSDAMANGRSYEAAVLRAIEPILNSSEAKKSPYVQTNDSDKLCIVLIAGDRGLAGGYNANVFRALRSYPDADVIPIGKKACERLGKSIVQTEGFGYDEAYALADKLCESYKDGKYKSVAILGTKYVSMLSQEPCLTNILPLSPTENKTQGAGMIFEPDELSVLNTTVPIYVAGRIIAAVKESFASEIAARRCAMDSAGKNAQQMIDDLQLKYNRARQSAITQEITEIVAGSGN